MDLFQVLQRLTSPPKQTLTEVQPTPSTIHLTVSTRSPPETLPALALHYAALLVRFLIGACALLAPFAKWKITAEEVGYGRSGWVAEIIGIRIVILLRNAPWMYLVPGVAVIVWLALQRGYTEESLLILRGLGLQTSTSSSTYLHNATTRFIPTTSIQDIFIHEAFRGFEVRFYLAIVVKGEEDVVVVFPTLLPRREVLELVWGGARACLYEGGRGKSAGEDPE